MIRQQISLDIKRLVVIVSLCMTATTLPTYAQAQNQYAVATVEDEQGRVLDDWIVHNSAILIKLNPQQSDSAQSQNQLNTAPQFQVFIGDHDVSSLFSFNGNQLAFKGDLPLPHGENALEVKQFIDGEWLSIGSNTLRVLSSAGFKVATWQPRLEVSINSQLDEQTSGDQVASDNPRFTDVTSSFGLSSDHQNDQLSIQSNFNLLSVSNRQQAVQFSTEGNQAAKLDLTDYAINIKNGNHQIVLGHTSYGSNSLLIDNLSRRGIKWRYQNESSLSISDRDGPCRT